MNENVATKSVLIYKAVCLDVAQGRMNGTLNEKQPKVYVRTSGILFTWFKYFLNMVYRAEKNTDWNEYLEKKCLIKYCVGKKNYCST